MHIPLFESLEAMFAPAPVTDGSAVLAHDGYDVGEWQGALRSFGKLASAVETGRERLATADALVRDVFWSFHKRAPVADPLVPLTAAHDLHREWVEQVMGTVEWASVRAAGTVGDPLNAALATMGVTAKVIDALTNETLARLNRLHEAESGAADLFARAETLEDLAEQAEGDRAAGLYAQARQARTDAEALEAEARAHAEALETEREGMGETVRRAARTAGSEVEATLDALREAAAMMGGNGGGWGQGQGDAPTRLSAQERLDLAQRVQRSRRLQELAAMCGRLTQIALQVQRTKVQHPPDEVASITVGRDIGHVLPSEVALLTDPTLETLFYQRYAEGRLMQYDLRGSEPQGQGPLIVALDGSGSMTTPMAGGWTREMWAKGVMLALLAIARKQERDMAVIQFGDTIRTWEFPKGRGEYPAMLDCIEHFMNAGRENYPAWMGKALELAERSEYARADVICIADGQSVISDQQKADWQTRRAAKQMRAYGVLLGNEGAAVLASITDAVLRVDDLMTGEDEVLETIFKV